MRCDKKFSYTVGPKVFCDKMHGLMMIVLDKMHGLMMIVLDKMHGLMIVLEKCTD